MNIAEFNLRYAPLIEKHRSYMRARFYSEASIESYTYEIKRFTSYLLDEKGIKRPQEVTRDVLRDWQNALHSQKRKWDSLPLGASSKAGKIRAVKNFFVFLVRTGEIAYDPSIDLESPRLPENSLKDTLKKREVARLIEMAKGKTPIELRDRAILEVLYSTGLRSAELRNLSLEDVDLGREEVKIIKGKYGKSRVVPLGRMASAWIDTYVQEARPRLAGKKETRLIFLTERGERLLSCHPNRIVKKYSQKAGIKKRTFAHLMRHTCATHLLKGGADIRYVQELLGHASLDTTKVYTKIEIADLKRVHRRSHPREKI